MAIGRDRDREKDEFEPDAAEQDVALRDRGIAVGHSLRIEAVGEGIDDPWRHRSVHMRCASCMFFVPKAVSQARTVGPAGVLGRCRRHAPTMSGFPAVYAMDWCGDHKLSEDRV